MKAKKIVIMAFIAIVLAAGWYVSVREATGMNRREAQNALLEEADAYAAKGLYVRAIPLYEEALSYHTERTEEIESALLNAYREYGNISSYISLMEKRIDDGTAAEWEYMETADYYLEHYRTDMAMERIKCGMERLNTKQLEDYYEEKRYAYEMIVTDYEEIIPTEMNELMPAYDGEAWVYIDRDGRDVKIGTFESAVPFNEDGYGVVSQNGIYYTILENGDRYGVDELGVNAVYGMSGSRILAEYNGKYSYYDYDFQSLTGGEHQYDAISSHHDGAAAVKTGEKWGIIREDGEVIVDFSLEDVAVNSLGTAFAGNNAMVKISGSWYLIDTEGNQVMDIGYADAKAPESETGYIAVSDSSGKWGYIDRSGQIVIPCIYDDARSFSNGLGAVMLGSTWNYISVHNEIVIDIGFSDAQPFHNGVAQAGMTDGKALIILDYFES